MKKIILSSMLMMLTTLFPVTASADNIKDVQAQYKSVTAPVVSVDVIWGSLAFTYAAEVVKTWDPETHQFTKTQSSGAWAHDEGANEITIINHSNTTVQPHVSYIPDTKFQSVHGYFKTPNSTWTILPVAEGMDHGRVSTAQLSLTGSLTTEVEDAAIGTVSLTIHSGEGYDDNGNFGFDMTGVRGNQLLFGYLGWENEVKPHYTQAGVQGSEWAKQNIRFVKRSEVEALLQWMKQTNPNQYNARMKNSAILCEDGTYHVETETPSKYLYLGIREQALD